MIFVEICVSVPSTTPIFNQIQPDILPILHSNLAFRTLLPTCFFTICFKYMGKQLAHPLPRHPNGFAYLRR